jgi:hypothetical protein
MNFDRAQNESGKRPKRTHIFAKAKDLHYVEPEWCSVRLFETERFSGRLWDPFTGWGRVVEAARSAGYPTWASDKTERGYPLDSVKDFLEIERIRDANISIVSNPPFEDPIAQHAIRLNPVKMALIWPFARVVAAWPWLADAPLARVLLFTPRPPMPPGSYIAGRSRRFLLADLRTRSSRTCAIALAASRSRRNYREESMNANTGTYKLDDFLWLLPTNRCIYRPTGELWTCRAVDRLLPWQPVIDESGLPERNAKGELVTIPASTWLARHGRGVVGSVNIPNMPEIIENMITFDGKRLTPHPGVAIYNFWRAS